MTGNLRFLPTPLLAILAGCGAAPDPAKVTTGEAQAVREAAEMIGARPAAAVAPPPPAAKTAPAL